MRVSNERCIGCHATPTASTAMASLAEGVSCESCHGRASGWIEKHTATSWTKLTPHVKESQYGLVNTPDLNQRAAVCTRCHVGPGEINGQLFDANHDLIAAGHPPMNFEFTSYLAHLPPHWDTSRDRSFSDKTEQTRRDDFAVESWTAGQLASARAALQRLRTRGDRSRHADQPNAIWPEFAEYECSACHHTLQSTGPLRSPSGRAGRLVWEKWHLRGIRSLRVEAPVLEELSDVMAASSPNTAVVSRLAATGLVQLDEAQRQFARQRPAARDIVTALRLNAGNWNWDEATHAYLAVVALSDSYSNVAGGNVVLRQKLDEFRKLLEQPAVKHGADSRPARCATKT